MLMHVRVLMDATPCKRAIVIQHLALMGQPTITAKLERFKVSFEIVDSVVVANGHDIGLARVGGSTDEDVKSVVRGGVEVC